MTLSHRSVFGFEDCTEYMFNMGSEVHSAVELQPPVGPGRVGHAGRALQVERLAIIISVMDIAQFSNPHPYL